MRVRWLISILLVWIASLILAQPVQAQLQTSEPVSRTEFRELLIKIAERLDHSGSRAGAAAALRQRIDSLDSQSFEWLYRFSNNWTNLRTAVALMSTDEATGEGTRAALSRFSNKDGSGLALSAAGLPADLFSTAYPTGGNYATFRATLPGLGAMIDTPGSVPGLDDERCDANFEAGVGIASATFAFGPTYPAGLHKARYRSRRKRTTQSPHSVRLWMGPSMPRRSKPPMRTREPSTKTSMLTILR
jgi:hypothetical protein